MSFFSKFFKNNKKSDDSSDAEFVKKNYVDIVNYWSDIIEGTKKLEDGSKFNDNTVYNTKHLKHSKKQIQLAVIQRGMNAKNDKDFQAVQVCYMWLANFNDVVKDKEANSTQEIMDLVTEYGEKDQDKLIEEMAKLPHDSKKSKEFFEAISKEHLKYSKFFEEVVKKTKTK